MSNIPLYFFFNTSGANTLMLRLVFVDMEAVNAAINEIDSARQNNRFATLYTVDDVPTVMSMLYLAVVTPVEPHWDNVLNQ